jgi:signal transduction histidine kinase
LNNGNEVSFSFMKRRVFYQTWWFYVLCIVGLAGAAWAIYRLRLRQMRTRFAAVLDERNRLAREIHDTVIQGCTGLSAVLEAMAITSTESDRRQNELLNYAREQTRATIHEARRAVWDMRHEREEDLSLLDAMHALAAQTMREHPEVEVQVEGSAALRLRSSALQEVAMVLREAVGNAVQHSGTRRIELTAASDPKGLTVQVRDFGCGISEAEIRTPAPGHFGVMGMRERMKRLGGTLDVRVAAEGGTIVKLNVSQTHARRLEYSETA